MFILDGVSPLGGKILGLEEPSLFFMRIIAQCLRSCRNGTNLAVFFTDRARDLVAKPSIAVTKYVPRSLYNGFKEAVAI